VVREIRRFFSGRGVRAFWTQTTPQELLKLVAALLGVAMWLICFFRYPFPTPEPCRLVSLIFLAGSFLLAIAAKRFGGSIAVPLVDSVPKLLFLIVLAMGTGGVLIVGGLVVGGPLGFYTFSLLGLGTLLWIFGPILLRARLDRRASTTSTAGRECRGGRDTQ
jgi:hypothetical protein